MSHENHTRSLTLRRATTSDEPFLFESFTASRERELLLLPPELRVRFARHQYEIFNAGLRDNYPGADHFVLEAPSPMGDDRLVASVGRLVFMQYDHRLLLIDIAILPAYRNRGLGSAALEMIMDSCREGKKTIIASVTPYNPARRLYARHGFVEKHTESGYIGIEWRP